MVIDDRLLCSYVLMMRIVWDEPKRLANMAKHQGLDFATLTEAFFEDALILPGKSKRWRGIGPNLDGIICVVFARYRHEGISFMSMRPASLQERKAYAQSLKD